MRAYLLEAWMRFAASRRLLRAHIRHLASRGVHTVAHVAARGLLKRRSHMPHRPLLYDTPRRHP